MRADLNGIKQWFDGYVAAFDLSVHLIEVKNKHSRAVMDIGEKLTEALQWSRDDADLGTAACLLHDTGRFTQYMKFRTYSDSASIDHGDSGHDVLAAELPESLTDGEGREAILAAVKWHNKKVLSELSPSIMPFCRLTRDADKLDIMALVQRSLDDGSIAELLPRHKIGAPISPVLLGEVEASMNASYKNASSLLDHLLIQYTWALDINYAPSLDILESSGTRAQLRSRFPRDDQRVQALLTDIDERVAKHREDIRERKL